MQLVGGLRIGSASDDSFYDIFLSRLPKEVKNTGRITRFLAFDFLTAEKTPITFWGIEVDEIEDIPEGMIAWVLDDHNLTVLETKNSENVVIWQEVIEWEWRSESPSEYKRSVTGEFTVLVPPEWAGTSDPDKRFFTMTVNMYTAPGQTGSDNSIHLVDYDPE